MRFRGNPAAHSNAAFRFSMRCFSLEVWMLTAREIAQRLSAQAESVASYLLPGGRRVGREWVAGSTAGDEGKSLKVCVAGDKSGLWSDFATGESGDLLDLWRVTRNLEMGRAMREAREYLGIADDHLIGVRERTYRKPERPPVVKAAGNVLDYLCSRGLTLRTIEAFHVRANADDDEIVFPFIRDRELVNIKYLKLDRPGGKKIVRQEKDAEPCLFGWHTIPPGAREVVICEGEIDAMTWWQKGFPALSAWSGAGNLQWIENDYDRLLRFDTIYLSFDMDEAGKIATSKVLDRLGRIRCRVVKLPHKDANECLMQGVTTEQFRGFIAEAQTADPEDLRSAASYAKQVMALLFPDPNAVVSGWKTPFDKVTQHGGRFNEGELVILNGINGHGKTSFASELALCVVSQGGRACIASMEVKAPRLIARMVAQALAQPEPKMTKRAAGVVMGWWTENLFIYEVLGTANANSMLDRFRYARYRYGVKFFIIDSLAKCGIAEDDYKAQKAFVEALCDFKNETDSCVVLVTHSRKLETEMRTVDKMDVKGTGAITDLADTVTTLWRNKAKERDREGRADEPDAFWYWQKNRNGEFEGTVKLWYNQSFRRFKEDPNGTFEQYVTPDIERAA